MIAVVKSSGIGMSISQEQKTCFICHKTGTKESNEKIVFLSSPHNGRLLTFAINLRRMVLSLNDI